MCLKPRETEPNHPVLFNAKSILVEHLWHYLTHRWEKDEDVHAFPKGIKP